MKNVEVKLHINENVKPMHQSQRHIPFHQLKNLEACVKSLLQQDIIEPADGPIPWVSPMVLVLKPRQPGWVRIAMRGHDNKAISRGRHLMPTLDEVLHDLFGACIVLKGLVSKNGQSGWFYYETQGSLSSCHTSAFPWASADDSIAQSSPETSKHWLCEVAENNALIVP